MRRCHRYRHQSKKMKSGAAMKMAFQPCANATCRKPTALDHCDGPAGLLCCEHLLIATGIDLSFVDGIPRAPRAVARSKGKPEFLKRAERRASIESMMDRGDDDDV